MAKTRPVIVRVEEFMKTSKSDKAIISHSEMSELLEMFGVAERFCDTFQIINTSFCLGYMKGMKAMVKEKNLKAKKSYRGKIIAMLEEITNKEYLRKIYNYVIIPYRLDKENN